MSPDPILPGVRGLYRTLPADDTPSIQPSPLSLMVSIAPTHNPLNFSDHNAFDHMFVNEMETKAAIEQLLDEVRTGEDRRKAGAEGLESQRQPEPYLTYFPLRFPLASLLPPCSSPRSSPPGFSLR